MEWKNLQATSQASFYGKAKIGTEDNKVFLKSYDTVVACIDTTTNSFTRLWSGYSLTTLNHVNDFRSLHNLPSLSKKEWLAIPCKDQQQLYKIQISNGFYNRNGQQLFTEEEAEKEVQRLDALYNGDRYNVYIDMVEA